MEITVRLLASYRAYLPDRHDRHAGFRLEVEPGSTVGTVVAGLPIPRDGTTTVLVNGRHAGDERRLQDGDLLAVFPAVGGG